MAQADKNNENIRKVKGGLTGLFAGRRSKSTAAPKAGETGGRGSRNKLLKFLSKYAFSIILVIILIAALVFAITSVPRQRLEINEIATVTMVVTPEAAATTTMAAAPKESGEQKTQSALLGSGAVRKTALVDPFSLRMQVRRTSSAPPAAPSGRAAEPEKKPAGPELEGIWYDADMRVAFISGIALTEGATVMGWRVSRIHADRVVLVKGKNTRVLRIGGE